MSTLSNEIETRHQRDGWRDAVFVVFAVVVMAAALGSTTSKAVGHPSTHQYSLTVVENPELAK